MALTLLFNGDSHTSHSPQFEVPTISGDPYQTPNGSRVKDVADPTGVTGTCISLRTHELDHNSNTADWKTRSQGVSPNFIDPGEYVTQAFLGYIPSSLPSAPQFFTMASIYGNPFGGSGTRSMQLGSKPSAATHSFFVKDHNEVTFFRATVGVNKWWKIAFRMFFQTPGWCEVYFADDIVNPFVLQTLLTGGTRRTYNIREASVNGGSPNHIKVLNYHRYPWSGVSGFTEWFVKYHRGYDGAPALSTTQYAAELNAITLYQGAGTTPTVQPPTTPTNLRVTGIASQSVSLACDAEPAANVQPGDTYQWYVNESSNYFTTAGPTNTITTVTPGGAVLLNGTAYNFRVSFGGATNRTGTIYSGWTDPPVTATPSAVTTTPAVPTGLRVTGVGDREVRLDWNDNTDTFGQYQVYRDSVVVASGLTQSQYIDNSSTLLNDNVYSYQVRAGNTGNQSALSSAVQATPTASTTQPLSQLSDEFNTFNTAVWTPAAGISVSGGKLVITPSDTVTDAATITVGTYALSGGSEVRIVGVTPYQGSASGNQFVVSVLLGTTQTRVSLRIADGFLVNRHFQEGFTPVDGTPVAYDAATMKNIGVRFPATNQVQFFTETAAGVRTVRETRDLPFDFSGSNVKVRIGASISNPGTVTAPASVESINPVATNVAESANLDPAEEKRLLDDSLVPGTSYSVRLVATLPTASAVGTQLTGGGYAAQTVQFTNAVSTGSKTFTATVAFPAPTADWAEIVGFEVWTTGGTPVRKWLKAYSVNERRKLTTGGPAYRIPASTLFRLN